MKVTKKLLSVLLAVTMIMSSMSVCFGIDVFGANSTTSEFMKAVQCNAMANFVKPTATKTGTKNNKDSNYAYSYSYSLSNAKDYTDMVKVLTTFDSAFKGLLTTKQLSHNNDKVCENGASWCTDEADVLNALKNDIGTNNYNTLNSNYHLGDFLGCLLDPSAVGYRNESNDSFNEFSGSANKTNPSVSYNFTVSISRH